MRLGRHTARSIIIGACLSFAVTSSCGTSVPVSPSAIPFATTEVTQTPAPVPTAVSSPTHHGLAPTPTPEVLGNGWYRYTDTEAGYSISYPDGTYLDAQNEAGLDFLQATIGFPTSVGNEIQEMLISVYSNTEGAPLDQLVQKVVYQGRLPENRTGIHLTPVRIAGLDAAKLELVPFYPAVLFSAKGRVYFVALPMNMLWGNPPTQASVDLFYKIIDTFRLTVTQ